MADKLTIETCKARFKDKLFEIIEPKIDYEPTGLQEDIIYSVGCGKYEIVLVLDANDVGKTITGIQILKNVIWPCDNKWFAWWEGYSLFRDRTFALKQFRITGTSEALSDTGAIRTEIVKWWPKGEYADSKAGKRHYSEYAMKNGWSGDCLSYNQDRTEYESKKLSIVVSDEPPPHQLIGAITSRFSEGCLWVITATPLQCGIFLDVIDDLEEKGTKVKRITGTIFENSIVKGKTNHLGTKRGLRSDEEIESKVARCPIDERDARLYGKASNKSGKIYPMYDDVVHCKEYDIQAGYLQKCNCFVSIDPHRKYYPFIKWYAVTPDNMVWQYNEWPSYETLGNNWYDEIRDIKQFDMTEEQLAGIILANDMSMFGAEILWRAIDPRYNAENPGFVLKMAEFQVTGFRIPPFEKIEEQRNNLRGLLHYNASMPLNEFNCPGWYVSPRCKNSRRAYMRHYWKEQTTGRNATDGEEAEEYKDPLDDDRYFLSLHGGVIRYEEKKKPVKNKAHEEESRYKSEFMKETALG